MVLCEFCEFPPPLLIKDNVSIEQWLTPMAGGKAARNKLSIKKLGIKVGSSDGVIRKVD